MQKIKIKLAAGEISFLKKFKSGKDRTAREINRANILLLCHRGKQEKDISDFLGANTSTIWRVKKRYSENGLGKALADDARPGQPVRYGERHKTQLTAIACSDPPAGRERWTLALLTEKMRACKGGCENISREAVRLMLKKTDISPGLRKCGV